MAIHLRRRLPAVSSDPPGCFWASSPWCRHLHPAGSCSGRGLPGQPVTRLPVGSYPTISPLPARLPAVSFCGTLPEVSLAGCYPAPCSAELGLSSAGNPAAAICPPPGAIVAGPTATSRPSRRRGLRYGGAQMPGDTSASSTGHDGPLASKRLWSSARRRPVKSLIRATTPPWRAPSWSGPGQPVEGQTRLGWVVFPELPDQICHGWSELNSGHDPRPPCPLPFLLQARQRAEPRCGFRDRGHELTEAHSCRGGPNAGAVLGLARDDRTDFSWAATVLRLESARQTCMGYWSSAANCDSSPGWGPPPEDRGGNGDRRME